MKLTDLNAAEVVPILGDFSPAPEATSVLNAATVNNAAGHASLLSNPEEVMRSYSLISQELANSPSSPALDNLLTRNQTVDRAAMYSELNKILGDPNISMDEKTRYMDGYINSSTDRADSRSLSVLVAEKALAESPGPEDNDEVLETTMFDFSDTLDNEDAYRGWVQKEINLKTNLQNREWYDWALDFTELMVPFADQAGTAKTLLDKGDGAGALGALLLPGNAKENMRNALAKMPVEDRVKAAQALIELVRNSGGSITPRKNTLQMINQLNAYLVTGQYDNTDKFLDNIFAVADAVLPFVSGLGKLAGKGVKGAADLERAAGVERKVTKIADEVETTIVEAVPEPVRFDADQTTLDGLKQLVHDKISPALIENKVPFEDVEGMLAKIDELIVAPNLTNTKKLAKDIATVIKPAMGKTKPNKTADDLVKFITEESNTNRLMVRSLEDYHSMAATFRGSNPKKARTLNAAVEADQTDASARAAYGTTRQEAIVNDRAPEVGFVDGSVRNKVEMDEAGPSPDTTTVNSIKNDRGRTDLTPEEKSFARGAALDAFKNVKGLVPRKAMATVDENTMTETPTGASFNMVYGPRDGGFSNAKDGVYQVLMGLKKYGVTGKEVEVLAKDVDGKYHVVTGIPTDKGNYLVRVKHDYEFAPGDVVDKTLLESDKFYRMFESRSNLTDGNAGGLLQHFIPSSAIIDRVIFNSASVASDRSATIQKRLIKLAADYAKLYKKLSPRQKALVDDYRLEANNKGIPFNTPNLRARGFDDDAIEAMRGWKLTTDTMWWLENVDLNKNLRGLGWQRFTDPTNDTDLIARPVANRSLDGAKVYDPVSNTIRKINSNELKDLYDKNGTVAELKRPLEIGDDDADLILVPDGASGYLRRIRDEDTTLPYRDGYYPIKYDAPIFIRKQFKKKDGGTYFKAIAVAGNHGDANALLSRLRATDQTGVYVSTGDFKRGSSDFHDAEWDVVVSTGRSAQRVRGTRLADASSPTDLNHVHVESPEESLISSIKSISSRTAFRDWLETSKSRWLANYGKLIDPQNPNQWPTSAKQIGSGNLETSNALVKDAKANWRFIHSMESGYINVLDDGAKNFFANFADTAGRSKSWNWLEKPLQGLSRTSPSAFARKKAFRLLLAANPLRQLPVQAMQALPTLIATNPLAIPKISMQMVMLDSLANGVDAGSFMKAFGQAVTGMSVKEARELAQHWESSGFEAAVDAHSLIRDQLGSLVDRTPWQKSSTLLAKPLDLAQKVGFNAGERLLMRSVWLSEYDLLRKAKKTIDAEALENLNARVRNLTLNMNRAGEMPYNENVFSSALQFFQAPHKAFAQILLGHKGLTGWDRLRLGASYVTVYGLGAGPLTNLIMSNFKGDEQTREVVEGGVFNMALNASLRNIFHDDTNVDFSDSLRLLPQPDVFKFWQGLMRADVGELLSSSPSASLIIGDSPRVTNFVRSLMRPFVVDNSQRPEEFMLVGKNFLDMFSGASNFFKAKYALEHQKQMSQKGVSNDWNVTPVESIAKLAGFASVDEIHYYASQEATYKASEKYKTDIKTVIDEVSARLADRGISTDEEGWYLTMMSEAQRVFGGDPVYMQEFANQIYYKARNGEYSIYTTLRRLAGAMDANEYDTMVDKAVLPEDMKNTLKQSKRMFEEIN